MKLGRPCRAILRRQFSGVPYNTAYYRLDPASEEILGPRRVESTKMEAAMRRIAEKLFLYDSAQRALMEDDMEKEGSAVSRPQQSNSSHYLQDFLDSRDAVPRPLQTTQNRLGRQLRGMLNKAHIQQQDDELVLNDETSTISEIAQFFWSYQIRRISTYHLVVREMVVLGHTEIAQDILQTMLMTQRAGLKVSTYTLCLETAMLNNNHQWFMDLSRRATTPSSKWGSFQAKFAPENYENKLDTVQKVDIEYCGAHGLLLLAEGFMKFGHPHLLNSVLYAAKAAGSNAAISNGTIVKMLAANMEAASRWNDAARAKRTMDEFEKIWDPSKKVSVRFLLLAKHNSVVKSRAFRLYSKLNERMQRMYWSLMPNSNQYHHPYAS